MRSPPSQPSPAGTVPTPAGTKRPAKAESPSQDPTEWLFRSPLASPTAAIGSSQRRAPAGEPLFLILCHR